MTRTTYLFISLLLLTGLAQAQVGIGTITPVPSAALEVVSTTKGVLISRMTAAQRTAIASPAEGLMVYQTNAPIGLWMFINGAWTRLTTTSATDAMGASTGFAANTTGAIIAVVLGGTVVPLPNAVNVGTGITFNTGTNTFTVTQTGRYRVAYGINLTAALLVSSRIVVNTTPVAATVVNPVLALSRLSAEAVINLIAGDQVRLELFGLLGAATLLGGSQGAALTIQRVE